MRQVPNHHPLAPQRIDFAGAVSSIAWNGRLGVLALGGHGIVALYTICLSDVQQLMRGKRAAQHTSHLAGADSLHVAKPFGPQLKGPEHGHTDTVAVLMVLDQGKLISGG